MARDAGAGTLATVAGARIEVTLSDEGLAGSRYTAVVVALSGSGNGLKVQFDNLVGDDDEAAAAAGGGDEGGGSALVATHAVADCRPLPPPTSAGFFEQLRPGSQLELLYDDGWWPVELLEAKGSGGSSTYRVVARLYRVEHTVTRAELRPGWEWAPTSVPGSKQAQGGVAGKWVMLAPHESPLALVSKGGKAKAGGRAAQTPPARSVPPRVGAEPRGSKSTGGKKKGGARTPAAAMADGGEEEGDDSLPPYSNLNPPTPASVVLKHNGERWLTLADIAEAGDADGEGEEEEGACGSRRNMPTLTVPLRWTKSGWKLGHSTKRGATADDEAAARGAGGEEGGDAPSPAVAAGGGRAAAGDGRAVKQKGKRAAKPRALSAAAQRIPRNGVCELEVGMAVEVAPEDEGFYGGWYAATVLELAPNAPADEAAAVAYSGDGSPTALAEPHALVRYADVVDETGAVVVEWQPQHLLRPLPPPTALAFAPGLKGGEHVQVRMRDGWWEATLTEVEEKAERRSRGARELTNPGRFRLALCHAPKGADAVEAGAHELRPAWVWGPDFVWAVLGGDGSLRTESDVAAALSGAPFLCCSEAGVWHVRRGPRGVGAAAQGGLGEDDDAWGGGLYVSVHRGGGEWRLAEKRAGGDALDPRESLPPGCVVEVELAYADAEGEVMIRNTHINT
ncbi:hypothetical protein T492DRAFT_372505 [Pavlovales sp. CCMP2436]|nr:hypothetical protein T492DRAFT_372505 [Pavlovales sp. CCMP2436]